MQHQSVLIHASKSFGVAGKCLGFGGTQHTTDFGIKSGGLGVMESLLSPLCTTAGRRRSRQTQEIIMGTNLATTCWSQSNWNGEAWSVACCPAPSRLLRWLVSTLQKGSLPCHFPLLPGPSLVFRRGLLTKPVYLTDACPNITQTAAFVTQLDQGRLAGNKIGLFLASHI